MNRPTITAERIHPSGGWHLSAVVGEGNSYLVWRSYYGYTKQEALTMFRQLLGEF
jgi:hypothetical protein